MAIVTHLGERFTAHVDVDSSGKIYEQKAQQTTCKGCHTQLPETADKSRYGHGAMCVKCLLKETSEGNFISNGRDNVYKRSADKREFVGAGNRK